MKRKWIFFIPLFIALFIFAGGEIVQHLWNWLLPPLFGWHTLAFWQAVGLLVLSRILFGNFGPRGRRGCGGRWSPEERDRFREEMRARWGGGPAGPGPASPASASQP